MNAAELVDRALERMGTVNHWMSVPQLRKLDEVQAILGAPDDLRRDCVFELAERSVGPGWLSHARQLLPLAARKRLPLTADETARLVTIASPPAGRQAHLAGRVLSDVAGLVEAAAPQWSDAERDELAPLIEGAAANIDDHKLEIRLRRLVTPPDSLPLDLIGDGDDVGPRFAAVLEASAEERGALAQLLEALAGYPDSGKPSRRRLAQLGEARDALDRPAALVADLLDAMLDAEDTLYRYRPDYQAVVFFAGNERLACGVASLAGRLGDASLLDRLRRLSAKSATTIGGQFGSPRSLRLANLCAQAIADVGAPASITELLALERAVRHGTLLNQIRKAIDSLAAAQGMTRDELLERAVEDHGLDADGTRTVQLERGQAVVEVDATSVTLTYVDEDGKSKKSFPADLKEAVAETRAELKGIRKTIAGERHRLDGLMASGRRWAFEDWRAYYLDHPVTGRLTRRAIWGFGDVTGIPVDAETAIASSGEQVAIPAGAEVRLWHPVHAEADEVQAWRLLLLERLIVQPFKQAFREVYILTPAERQTRVYSNRFASHVFRQVQARALMKGRGWKPVAVAWWDDGIDHGVARRTYESLGLRAEFFFDPIFDMEPETGDLYPYCTSDQLRFFRAGDDAPIELADVPLLVLTEAMRDVDLFVGVTSIPARSAARCSSGSCPSSRSPTAARSTSAISSCAATCAPTRSTSAAATSRWSRTISTCASSAPATGRPTRCGCRSTMTPS